MGIDIAIKIGPYVKCLKESRLEFDEEVSCKVHGRKRHIGDFCEECGARLDKKRVGEGILRSDIDWGEIENKLKKLSIVISNMEHDGKLYDIYILESAVFDVELYDIGVFEIDEELINTTSQNFLGDAKEDIIVLKAEYGENNITTGFGMIQNAG